MHWPDEQRSMLSRRQFFGRAAGGVGTAAMASLLNDSTCASDGGVLASTHCPAKAKRVIYLFMHGGPSQIDLFDYKPELAKRHGEDLPASIRMNQRLTGMTSGQKTLPVAPSPFKFAQYGESGAWVS